MSYYTNTKLFPSLIGEGDFIVSCNLLHTDEVSHPDDLYGMDISGPQRYAMKNRFCQLYGSRSLKKFTSMLKECMVSFDAVTSLDSERNFIRKAWNIQKIFRLFEDSLELMFAKTKQLIIRAYQQTFVFETQLLRRTMTEKMKKAADQAIQAMTILRKCAAEKISENLSLFICLEPQYQLQFVQNAMPDDLCKFGRIHKRYWLPENVAEIAAPKYSMYWSKFWTPILARNLRFGVDICRMIAEYIPEKLGETTFVDFFHRHHYSEKYSSNAILRPFVVDNINDSQVTLTLKCFDW